MNQLLIKDGALQSVYPANTRFGELYFSHMVPPFKPASMCILGYGGGTIAELTRKIWGLDVKITGVDKEPADHPYIEYKLITKDALQYVKECTKTLIKTRYEYVVVDLYDGFKIADFVYSPEFATMMREMCSKQFSINIPKGDGEKLEHFYYYGGFKFDRMVHVEGQEVWFWKVENVE